jgi:hypothetical protein
MKTWYFFCMKAHGRQRAEPRLVYMQNHASWFEKHGLCTIHTTQKRASPIAPVIAELQPAGAASLRAIAAGLNGRRIPTARGNGVWSAEQLDRVLKRFGTER